MDKDFAIVLIPLAFMLISVVLLSGLAAMFA